ncbi:uncharacterized protein LOC106637377 [Copidosoma floridanum]|uniref:uncharacterized protein LOC106637377 n=1 Tax=Copidosoma floridanum TaxID=29053 RepID=UPI0006C986D5|nr:uncharacterized protein LOC106637377 [Copidosoma floridanum]
MLLLLLLLSFFMTTESCKNLDVRRAISYRLIKANAQSKQDVMTRRRVASVSKCMDFAENKNALAFYFERTVSNEANCLLLRCPESVGIPQLMNVTGVDYYSAYPNNRRAENLSVICVENVGLFTIFPDRLNFTEARDSCRKIHGSLADVSNEARSRGLASMVNESIAYVGLSNEGNQRLWKNEFGDLLSCHDYRAWDSGEPSHSRGCVGLIQADYKNDPVWRVVPCATKLPYICELPKFRSFTNHKRVGNFMWGR